MKITSCKTNHLTNPLGYQLTPPTLSWLVEDTTSQTITSARILVSLDLDLSNPIVDTGDGQPLDNKGTAISIQLQPHTRYYWQVSATGDKGDTATSAVNWFETPPVDITTDAKWITPPWDQKGDDCPHPYLRREHFISTDNIAKARLYITGLGLYQLYVNNQNLSTQDLFAPHSTVYDAWLQYQTYDITELLVDGINAFGVSMANGWAKGRFGTFNRSVRSTEQFSLLCYIEVTYKDGSVTKLGTDENWVATPSPITFDNMYDGIHYDANKEIKDWAAPYFDATAWQPVEVIDKPAEIGEIRPRMSLPVQVMEEIKPVALIKTPAGEMVLDMGQNMVGWLRVKINAPKGTVIKITHGEILQNDNFYTENLRSAKQAFIYVSSGTPVEVDPQFAFYGFRYAKIEGLEDIDINDFTGCVLYSKLETRGHIETSDPNINRLFQNALWGQKGNFLDVPTDCPQRDERMGWTGDTQVFAGTALFNMDSYPFYAKFLEDLYQEQKLCGGLVPSTIPLYTHPRPTQTGEDGTGGGCAWSDCATILPWEMYLHTGDKTILINQYQSMKDWVGWVVQNKEKWLSGFHFGDWLALDGDIDEHGRPVVFGGTSTRFLASAYFMLSSEIVSKTAKLLGRIDDYQYYRKISADMKTAMFGEFFEPDGSLSIKTQTAHVIALHFGITPNAQAITKSLVQLLEDNDFKLATGFIGTPYLCRVLSENGASKAAYNLFMRDKYPSWLYPVSMGATTIWERWNSVEPDGKISDTGMNSLNHYAYGSIAEWMYRHMCGINPVESAPGFKEFTIRPEFDSRLEYVKGEVTTAMGKIKSAWKYTSPNTVEVTVTVPVDTTATIILPGVSNLTVGAGEYVLTAEV